MTDDSERDSGRSQRPAPPYVRRPGDLWREELPPITRYLYDSSSEPADPAQPTFEPAFEPAFELSGQPKEPREPVLESMEWTSQYPAARKPAPAPAERDQSGAWILEEWEQYDWKKAATLTADQDIVAAQQAWGDLEWESDAAAATRQRPPELVATILEGIARRIRAGELRVNGTPGMSEEAALAAVLATLLGLRR